MYCVTPIPIITPVGIFDRAYLVFMAVAAVSLLGKPPTPESERREKHTKPPHSVGNQRLGLGWCGPQIWGHQKAKEWETHETTAQG